MIYTSKEINLQLLLKVNANKTIGKATFNSRLTGCFAIYKPTFLLPKKPGSLVEREEGI